MLIQCQDELCEDRSLPKCFSGKSVHLVILRKGKEI